MRVLGIDPGTAVMGYGVVEADRTSLPGRLVECGSLHTSARDPLPARLREIHQGLHQLITRLRPDVMAVESVFYGRNVRTTVALAHARGVILLAAEQSRLSIAEYTPAMIKQTVVGRGAALKPQVGYMVAQVLRLKAPPRPADAADGVAVALTHLLRQFRAPRVARAR
jgi:crossover junction endodeoxyribonuclease RuvC